MSVSKFHLWPPSQESDAVELRLAPASDHHLSCATLASQTRCEILFPTAVGSTTHPFQAITALQFEEWLSTIQGAADDDSKVPSQQNLV
ncbi:hypothetical protein DFH09DRAFT_1312702 [Mycena vulgaris]|nr:hypothetical protein DFH09DRAFT_1312702 [Mycena vulgaris]